MTKSRGFLTATPASQNSPKVTLMHNTRLSCCTWDAVSPGTRWPSLNVDAPKCLNKLPHSTTSLYFDFVIYGKADYLQD